jgi:hypothetical protein
VFCVDVARVVALLLTFAASALLCGTAWAGDGARSFALHVPASSDTTGHWRTTPLGAGHSFELVGAEWQGDGVRVRLRARRASGRWSRWTRVVPGEPVWSGRAVAVQLRGARPVRGLRVHAVAVGDAARRTVASAAASGGDGQPAIVPRSAWDPRDQCHPRVQARYGRIDFGVVHHTESLSRYSPRQSAGIVLAICLFHRDGNRWNDIGYDLLVDRYGTVFEGRAGGVEQPTLGAQAGGWNAVSMGVAMIGSYSVAPPPAVALRSLERVLAWKLSLAGVPAMGSVRERSIGGDVNAHPRGAIVRFRRIAGHRDADFTDCPGGALYALLPRIRREVAALMPPSQDLLTLSPVGAPIEAAPWWLSGRLALASGRRPAGAAVRVEQQTPEGSWLRVAETRTGADGIWNAAPTLSVNGPLRAVAALPDGREAASQLVDAQVRARVRLRTARTHLPRGDTLRLSGTATPPKARVRIRVARRTRGNAVPTVFTRTVTATAGRFDLALDLAGAGVWEARASTAADVTNASGHSRTLVVRVLKRR